MNNKEDAPEMLILFLFVALSLLIVGLVTYGLVK